MGSIDYKKLYALQDEVLDIVFATEQVFYLTGGTCLSRFYQEKRYSDDLEFFTHSSDDFNRVTREIKIAHEKAGFNNDDLIIRLKTFPIMLLKNILLVDASFLDDFEEKDMLLIEKIENVI